MNKKPKCYIAHNIEIRDKVKKVIVPRLETYFQVINPFSESRLERFKGLNWEQISDLTVEECKTPNWVMSHDLVKIDECDCLFAYIENSSFGTPCEIFYAGYNRKIPVGVVLKDKKYIKHKWIQSLASTVGTIEQIDKVIGNLAEWFER